MLDDAAEVRKDVGSWEGAVGLNVKAVVGRLIGVDVEADDVLYVGVREREVDGTDDGQDGDNVGAKDGE